MNKTTSRGIYAKQQPIVSVTTFKVNGKTEGSSRDSLPILIGLGDSLPVVVGLRDSLPILVGLRYSLPILVGLGDSLPILVGLRDSLPILVGLRDSVICVLSINNKTKNMRYSVNTGLGFEK